MKKPIRALILGAAIGLPWNPYFYPVSKWTVLSGWLASFALVWILTSENWLSLFLSALVCNFIGFYWLKDTIIQFSGLNPYLSFLIFIGFLLLAFIPFLIMKVVYLTSPEFLKRNGIAIALALTSAHFFPWSIFPWGIGDTQISFTYFAQIAEIGGSLLITFLMGWLCHTVLIAVLKKKIVPFVFAFLAFLLLLLWGRERYFYFAKLIQEKKNNFPISTALIQGNISLKEKHNPLLYFKNVRHYFELSREALLKSDLVIMPETAEMRWLPTTVKGERIYDLKKFLSLKGKAYIIIGALTFKDEDTYYNSALLLSPSGAVRGFYHKKALMPFGEYTPFAKQFPFLAKLNESAPQFSRGRAVMPLNFTVRDKEVKPAVLICYEDVVRDLAVEGVKNGANLLVNITNDAWFGHSSAPYQHNQLASFRAIETRRYLLRDTNTGYTAVINPLGEVESDLKPFTSNVLQAKVVLLNYLTIYVLYGQTALKVVIISYWVLLLLLFFKRKKVGRRKIFNFKKG